MTVKRSQYRARRTTTVGVDPETIAWLRGDPDVQAPWMAILGGYEDQLRADWLLVRDSILAECRKSGVKPRGYWLFDAPAAQRKTLEEVIAAP